MRRTKGKLDVVGMIASSACAVHCLALPLFISGGLISGLRLSGHDVFESFFLVLTALIAGVSIVQGYSRHRNNLVALGFVVSMIIICLGFVLGHQEGHIIMAIGGGCLAIGHAFNRNYLTGAY
jgi:hypothetical protein